MRWAARITPQQHPGDLHCAAGSSSGPAERQICLTAVDKLQSSKCALSGRSLSGQLSARLVRYDAQYHTAVVHGDVSIV